VSILASDQQHIAEIFSGKVPEQANRFADIAVFELEEGLPLISGGLGAMACEVREAVELDRSALLIGLVKRTWSREDGMPLLYMDRAYRFMKSG